MVYKTDGSSHHAGVANEYATVKFINEKSTIIRNVLVPPDCTMKCVGGTKTKIDAKIVGPDGADSKNLTISIKNHKGKNGTFDWINTTEHTEAVKAILKEFKAGGVADRERFKDIFNTHLKTIGDATIRALLQKCADENPGWLIVNNAASREYILVSIPDLSPVSDWNYFLKFGNGITSAQIWRRLGAQEVNTNLRLRFVSNNGLKALFESKGSVPCFKIQQDKVKDFISSLKGAVRETWT
jgi:hypothetical protein